MSKKEQGICWRCRRRRGLSPKYGICDGCGDPIKKWISDENRDRCRRRMSTENTGETPFLAGSYDDTQEQEQDD